MHRLPLHASVSLFFALLAAPLAAQPVSVWLTTDDQKTLLQPQPGVAFAAGLSASTPTLLIDDRATRQRIEGFGASMTDSSAYLLNEVVPKSVLPDIMQALFDPNLGIGIAFLRNPMGASDLARTIYSYDDLPAGKTDLPLASFSIAHDQADIIPMLLAAKAVNPHIKTMASPWSPPGWMKRYGTMPGCASASSANACLDNPANSLIATPANYTAFAGYFVKYLQAEAQAGVPVDYISLQNEPLYAPIGYPGMPMQAAEQLTVLRDYLLPALKAANLSTEVLVYDHNWDTPSYPETVLADAAVAASPNLRGAAWHWYGGPPGAMTTVHNLFPTLPNYVTEASGGTWISDEVKQDFEMIVHSMRNWASAYVKWGLALDQNRGPNLNTGAQGSGGCNTCTPLVQVNRNADGTFASSSYPIDYYTLGHFSKFVPPGSVAVWSSNAPGLIGAAFITPESSAVLVAYNDSASSRTFQVAWQGRAFSYTLPPLAGATFLWPATLLPSGPHRVPSALGPEPLRSRLPRYTIPAARQLQASSYNQVSNLQSEPCGDTDGGFDLGYASAGSWAEYDNIDFGSGVGSVEVRWANGSAGSGNLEFHLDSVSGPLIAQTQLAVTGGWQTWQSGSATVTGAQGVHTLYVVFQSGGAGGSGNLNWFQFKP
jgi:glucosylceramidase